MLTESQIEELALRLAEAEEHRRQIPALTVSFPTLTIDDAYAVQKCWMDRKIAAGRVVKGYKVGLTSRAMQKSSNIDEPDYGVLLDDMLFEDGASLEAARFLDPKIEVELAFVLKDPLEGRDVTVSDVLEATDYVVPALELIDARLRRTDPETGYTRKVFDTIADNAASAGVIVGRQRIAPKEMDLRWIGAALSLNGNIEETGLSCGVLDHPANGVSWVCKRFAEHGVGLSPGQLILSGSFVRPVPVKAGDTVTGEFGSLGTVVVRFH